MKLFIPNVVILVFVSITICQVGTQKTDRWDACQCKWAGWNSWTPCTKRCWGVHMRKRQVWKKNVPECSTAKVCDAGDGSMQLARCNKKCTSGSYDNRKRKCVCPHGLYGQCCDQTVSCGKPPAVLHAKVNENVYNYSDVVQLKCKDGYHMEGEPEMTCGDDGWTGALPKCTALDPCKGVTCALGEVCQPKGNLYECVCPPTAVCNLDLAPEIEFCPKSLNITTTSRLYEYTWDVPKFKDAAGETLEITSNYPNNNYYFPWKKNVIQYTAHKPSNGQSAVCEFYVDVKPNPCEELHAPSNGFVVCNNWRTEYGRFCLVGCTTDYELPNEFESRQWLVCGSSGHWTPSSLPKDCNVVFDETAGTKEGALKPVGECLSQEFRRNLQKQFIQIILKSPFSSFCVNHEELCVEDNVAVLCWNSGFAF